MPESVIPPYILTNNRLNRLLNFPSSFIHYCNLVRFLTQASNLISIVEFIIIWSIEHYNTQFNTNNNNNVYDFYVNVPVIYCVMVYILYTFNSKCIIYVVVYIFYMQQVCRNAFFWKSVFSYLYIYLFRCISIVLVRHWFICIILSL